jgi:hypothetical protein
LLTLFVGVTLTAKALGLVVLTVVAPTGTATGAFGPFGPLIPRSGTKAIGSLPSISG